MKKKVHLGYACPIPWDDMLSTGDKERFCTHCQKKIRDFSKDMSPHVSGVECGRFSLSQVGSISRQFRPGPGLIATFSLAAILGLAPHNAQAQTEGEKTEHYISPMTYRLTGLVTDQKTGEAIPYANVILREPDGAIILGVTTVMDGTFKLEFSEEGLDMEKLVVEISSFGYEKAIIEDLDLNHARVEMVINVKIEPKTNELRGDIPIQLEPIVTGLIIDPEAEPESEHPTSPEED